MRKLLTALSLTLLLQTVQAQKTTQASSDFTPSYAVKFNPVGLLFGNIGLQGEYNFKKKKSLTFNVGIPVETTNSWLEIDDQKRDIKMKTFSVMAGYRMYMGKKTMTGFYFEPYLHYMKNEASTILDGDLDGQSVKFSTTQDYKSYGLGLQLGVQFMIAKTVAIDFFILGPEANMAKHSVVMKEITTTLPWDQADKDAAEREIKDAIGDLPIIGKKINVTVDPNQKTVRTDYDGFLPGFRTGLSVGIHF